MKSNRKFPTIPKLARRNTQATENGNRNEKPMKLEKVKRPQQPHDEMRAVSDQQVSWCSKTLDLKHPEDARVDRNTWVTFDP